MVLTLAEGRRFSLYWSVLGLGLVGSEGGEGLVFWCLEASYTKRKSRIKEQDVKEMYMYKVMIPHPLQHILSFPLPHEN